MTSPDVLLTQASAVLNTPTAHSNRAACWIARAALESTVDELLSNKDRAAPEASMRSKLTVLQVAFTPHDATVPAQVAFTPHDATVPARAEYAWSRLSQLCHHHAFELTPSASEAAHLIDLVRTLVPPAHANSG